MCGVNIRSGAVGHEAGCCSFCTEAHVLSMTV